MYKKYLKLDVVPGGQPQVIHISQDDERSRHLVFRLFASVGRLEMPDNPEATIKGTLPDGKEISIPGTVNNMELTFDIPAEAAEVPGLAPCAVALTSGKKRLYTETFMLEIDKNVVEEA